MLAGCRPRRAHPSKTHGLGPRRRRSAAFSVFGRSLSVSVASVQSCTGQWGGGNGGGDGLASRVNGTQAKRATLRGGLAVRHVPPPPRLPPPPFARVRTQAASPWPPLPLLYAVVRSHPRRRRRWRQSDTAALAATNRRAGTSVPHAHHIAGRPLAPPAWAGGCATSLRPRSIPSSPLPVCGWLSSPNGV